jgi:hypothetical protein
MAGALHPNELGYHARSPLIPAFVLVAVAGLLLFAATITGLWGVAALTRETWLHTGDLPVGDHVSWGLATLCLAMVQGITAMLLLFARTLGIVLAISFAALNVIALVAVIGTYPFLSILGIAVNLVIIVALVVVKRGIHA